MTDQPSSDRPTPRAPRCYRHLDVETWIRCSRCDKAICTQCMIEAPVGYRCPDCMQSERPVQPTTVAGAALILKPYVTYTLIVINVIVFAVQYSAGVNAVAEYFGMIPWRLAIDDQWYRLVTSAFLHGSFLHIGFNMLVLFLLGPSLERILGHIRFLTLYVMSAIGGAVASFTFSPLNTLSIGASGAVFGLMAGLVVAGRRLSYDVTQVLVLLGINVVIGFLAPGIDWRAHLGGLVVGAAAAAILVHAPRNRRLLVQISGLAGLLLILTAIAMFRSAQIQEMVLPMGVITT